MKATAANFLSIIKSPRQFVIPIYQRTYSWQITQCNKLLDDIIRISNNPSIPGHFIGSVVYFQESINTISEVPKLLVIDGQQRITTVLLLIAAIAEFIRDNKVEIDTNFTKLQNYYLLNAEEDGELRYKLILTKRDKDTLMNIIKGIKVMGEYSHRIAENFENFKNQISIENVGIIYNGIQRLFAVDVALEKDKDNPQLIFESMNSTGLDLSQADLIRNYILMGQDLPIQTELYEKYWYPMEQSFGENISFLPLFIRDYLTMKESSIPNIDEVYETFKAFLLPTNGNDITIEEAVKDLYRYSQFYVRLALLKETEPKLLKRIKEIGQLRIDVSYPFLMAVYGDYEKQNISIDEFVEILDIVKDYVFRRAICGIPTNSMNKTFATIYRKVTKENYLESVKAAFLLLDSYKRFPTDAEFSNELIIKDVYNFRSRNYLLESLENMNRKENINAENYTIEHILPQNPNVPNEWKKELGDNWEKIKEKYLHTIGNLTLTGYNSELSDKPFNEKKTINGGFNDSPLYLNESVRSEHTWNEEAILRRANVLAYRAKKIWLLPQLSDERLVTYKENKHEGGKTIYSLENYKLLKDEMLNLYNHLAKRILNIDSSVRVEFKKLYIAFKSHTNFVDIIPNKNYLRLSLNMKFDKIKDPKGICRNISGLGKWGNGDVEVKLDNFNEMDYIMELINQSFEQQVEMNNPKNTIDQVTINELDTESLVQVKDNSKFSNYSELLGSDLKIGEKARYFFDKLIIDNKLVLFYDKCNSVPMHGFDILVDVTNKNSEEIREYRIDSNGKGRYFADIKKEDDRNFILCNHWIDNDLIILIKAAKTLNLN